MAGNAWEWTEGGKRLHGGSWYNSQDVARCANRNRYEQYYRSSHVGFRCVRTYMVGHQVILQET